MLYYFKQTGGQTESLPVRQSNKQHQLQLLKYTFLHFVPGQIYNVDMFVNQIL